MIGFPMPLLPIRWAHWTNDYMALEVFDASKKDKRGAVIWNPVTLSDKTTHFIRRSIFVSRCQFGVSTDTIFKKRYQLDFNLNSNVTSPKHNLSKKCQKFRGKIINLLAPVNQILEDKMAHSKNDKKGNLLL
jgi:hypothetical protein